LTTAGHRAHDERRAEPAAEQVRPELDVGEVALGQRAMAQAHRAEARAGRVGDGGAGRDAEVVALAAGRVGVGHPSPYGATGGKGSRPERKVPRRAPADVCAPSSATPPPFAVS